MKIPGFLAVLLVSAGVAALTAHGVPPQGSAKTAESAYERVLRTGVLRCGYADWPPYASVKDVKTGQMRGIFPETIEAMAAKLNLKVEWTENTGWGGYIESLKTGRIDAFCSGLWRNAQRGRYVAYSFPVLFSPVYAYVRTDDHRFDKDIGLANAPDVKLSAWDGEMSDLIAREHFPKAARVSVPQLGQGTDILVNVATKKADVVFNEPSFVEGYTKANPGKLRRVGNVPFQVFWTSAAAVAIQETALRDMLDSALVELENAGVIEKILAHNNAAPDMFLRVARPYALP